MVKHTRKQMTVAEIHQTRIGQRRETNNDDDVQRWRLYTTDDEDDCIRWATMVTVDDGWRWRW